MGEQECCQHCLEPLCPPAHPRSTADMCVLHDEMLTAGAHHADLGGSPANEHCTRPKKMKVMGCWECFGAGRPDPIARCNYDEFTREIKMYVRRGLAAEPKVSYRPPWCPLTDDDGQPNAGILLVADVVEKHPETIEVVPEFVGNIMRDEGY